MFDDHLRTCYLLEGRRMDLIIYIIIKNRTVYQEL